MAIKIIKKGKFDAVKADDLIPHSLKLLKGMIPTPDKPEPVPFEPKVIEDKPKETKPLRRDKRERHNRLIDLIQRTIDGSLGDGLAIEFEGFSWAVRPQPEWATLLGVKNVDTISDLVKIPPIQKDYTKVDGKKALLLRVGPPGVPTPRKIANLMRGAFRAKTGRYPGREEFPLLKVLAEEWPDGLQVAIFKTVLNEWVVFKAGVANEIEVMKAQGEKAFHRHHIYPTVSVICRFRQVGLELYLMRLQENLAGGKPVPPSAVAAFPKIFGHLVSK